MGGCSSDEKRRLRRVTTQTWLLVLLAEGVEMCVVAATLFTCRKVDLEYAVKMAEGVISSCSQVATTPV